MSEIIIPQHVDDSQGNPQLGFTCFEQHGWEIYKIPENVKLTKRQQLDSREWPTLNGTLLYHKTLTNKNDIKLNDKIIFKGNPFDYVYNFGEVVSINEEDRFWACDGCNISPLEFDTDDRHCWLTSGSVINLKAVQMIKS